MPRWPGYETSEFWVNVSIVDDNILLSQIISSSKSGNRTVKISTPLPDSMVDQCALEGEATETYTELIKSKLNFHKVVIMNCDSIKSILIAL